MQKSSLRVLAISLNDVKIETEIRTAEFGCIRFNSHFGLVILF